MKQIGDKKLRTFTTQLPMDLYYQLRRVQENLDRKGVKTSTRTIVTEALIKYCKDFGEPETGAA